MTQCAEGGRRRPQTTSWAWRATGLIAASLIVAGAMGAVVMRRPTLAGPVVVISIDTLRADRLSIYGSERFHTPAIERLAGDGIVFDRAYSQVPLTLPAHASIFSGALPFEHGVRDNAGFTVPANRRLMAERFRAAGYATAGIVSADVLRADTGIARGFAYYDDRMPPVGTDVPSDGVQRDGAESVTRAERWLESQNDGKFFLFLHLYEPHAPYTPPARFADLDPYDGEIAYSDELVARVLRTLQQRGFYDTATIVLLADHGEGLGNHGEREHGLFLYDDTIRVPLVVKLPHGARRGTRVHEPVQHIDLLPTLIELTGLPADPELRGRSLRALLEGRPASPPAPIYAETLYGRYHFGWSELISLTDERFRYIRAPRDELYDLTADADERRNLADERGATRTAMRAALEHLVAGHPVAAPAPVSTDQRERLAALGYVSAGSAVTSTGATGDLPDPKDRIDVLERLADAMRAAASGDAAAVIPIVQRVVHDEPSIPDAWWQLGRALSYVGRDADAVDAYRQVVRLQPTNIPAVLAMASTLLRLQQTQEARQHATLAVDLSRTAEPRDRAVAYEMLARIAFAQADLPAARAAAAAAQAADPTLPLPDFLDGRVSYDAGQYREALDAFQRAAAAAAGRTRPLAELHLFLGDTLAYHGRYTEAEHEFREELRWFPRSVWAYASLANLLWAVGRHSEVADVLTRLLQQVPAPASYEVVSGLLESIGEPTKAATVRREARQRFGPDARLGS